MFQPDGYSCGPTCLKMILEMDQSNGLSIDDIKNIVGTDDIKGTTLEDMIVGLKHLNIRYEYPRLGNQETAIKYLNDSLAEGNPVILRTLTMGIKHWIIVDNFDGEYYSIKDPWLGKIKYDVDDIVGIWEPRNFDCLKILKQNDSTPTIRPYVKNDREQVNNLLIESFSHLMNTESLIKYIDAVVNYNMSIVVELNSRIIGAYLLGDRQVERGIVANKCDRIYISLNEYKNKIGLEALHY